MRARDYEKMKTKIKREINELKILLRSIPSGAVVLFAVSVIIMNLLANKSISMPVPWMALDCGIIASWVSFLSMDIITKHFGPKAATEISAVAALANLFACGFFFLGASIPGMWGEAYAADGTAVNSALDATFGGAWYVLFGSTTAFISSALVNNFLNFLIGRLFIKKPDGFGAYAARTYISTAVGQFADNMVFSLIVSHFFFGWTLTQCLVCSLTGMIAELLCEVVFSPMGFAVCRRWREENVGREYFEYINAAKERRLR